MPASYSSGDDGYDTLYAKWVGEGSPSGQFEHLGDHGGRRWRVHFQDDASLPTFLLIAAAGPTSTGYDEETETFKPPEWPGPTSGYGYEHFADHGLTIRPGAGGEGDLAFEMERPTRDTTI
jgi:hypothetical protein